MTVVFLCGCLEPGRDGVGDYTLRLAGDLLRKGHQASVLALNDHCLEEPFSGSQTIRGILVPSLRIPSKWKSEKRYNQAIKHIDHINPEWISFQFVPFSFHSKGLAFDLGTALNKLKKDRRVHIMFHELWVGMETGSNLKMQFWGYIQKRMIANLHSKVKPEVMHTQTRLYQSHLRKINIEAKFLPLFSNIPRTGARPNENFQYKKDVKNKEISFVIFGTIQNDAPLEQFTREVVDYKMKNNLTVNLWIIGRRNLNQKIFASIWKAAGLDVNFFGEQPLEVVSQILQKATFGIATTAFANIQKSGSVAAMREHGLRVICVSRPWKSRGMKEFKPLSYNNIVEYRQGNLQYCLEHNLENSADFLSVCEVSNQFTSALDRAT